MIERKPRIINTILNIFSFLWKCKKRSEVAEANSDFDFTLFISCHSARSQKTDGLESQTSQVQAEEHETSHNSKENHG